jgi:alginate O-acetyltransferase complex protein AlgI
MIFSILLNYYFAKKIDETRKNKNKSKVYLIIALILNIGLLIFFKYSNFLVEIINVFGLKLPYFNIALPIGISFYTFQALSYVIDVYWDNVKVQRNPLYLGCYITAFPQLIAGPIVRYETIEDELDNRKESISLFSEGVRRFILGLAKKVLIANSVAYVADTLFAYSASELGLLGTWIALSSYTLQIYFDFSGYSDMAIGLGRMLGFNFLENFNYPYIANSITDFWRRWHISLSSFFKDYVYIPLGGNRVKKYRHVLNIMIVWALTGLWHGASWNFLAWGLYYGILLLIEKFLMLKVKEKIPAFINIMFTLVFVLVGWVLFYYVDIMDGIQHIGIMFGFVRTKLVDANAVYYFKEYMGFIVVGVLASIPWKKVIKLPKAFDAPLMWLKPIAVTVLFVASIAMLVGQSYNPFLYFRF